MRYAFFILSLMASMSLTAQNFNFSFWGSGQRVCLTDATIDISIPLATIHFRESQQNTTQAVSVYRRPMNGNGSAWLQVATNLPPGTSSWTDLNVETGDVWEYQVRRSTATSDAIGYTMAAINYDQSNYRGQMILLLAENIRTAMPEKLEELKRDLTGEGWYVNELIVPRAFGWNSHDTVLTIKNQISEIYYNAPTDDKPKLLFILGHVPMPRSGLNGQAPDDHIQNAGARGADTFYADINGVFTDTETYNPGGLATPLAINLPGDFKWDQEFIPSELEMAFGRVDFFDLTSVTESEAFLTERYLDRLHKYRHIYPGWNMGAKSAFYLGYNNSNDGSYRSLVPLSGYDSVYQNQVGSLHPQWVENNGPFAVYMQNQFQPSVSEWNTYGMNATLFSSDQSYWGFGDVPEANQYSRIRALLALDTKCLVSVWTTMAINIFHQSGIGDPAGLACKQIMDHNLINQKLEKPEQPYDTPAFWNRMHFAFHGDPSIRFYQVYPPSAPQITTNGQQISIQWQASPDSRVAGYHIYKSNTEFGIYNRITSYAITVPEFIDPGYQTGDWYMIRAIVFQKTGSGVFINPSQGIFIQGTITLPGQPGMIAGDQLVCAESEQTYSIDEVVGASFYSWTIPEGWSGNSESNMISVTTGGEGGSITVTAMNQYGSGLPSALDVIVQHVPDPAGTISGNQQICGGTSQIYSIEPVTGASTYQWVLPAGWSGSSATYEIETIAGFSPGIISVNAANECGTGSIAQTNVFVSNLPEPAGEISGPADVCIGDISLYMVDEIPGADTYNWVLPEGASGSGNGNTIEVQFSPDAVSDYISVSGQNACGAGPEAEFFTTVKPSPDQPQVTLTGAVLMSDAGNGNQWYTPTGPIEGATGQFFEAHTNDLYHTIVTVDECSSVPSVPIYVIVTNTSVSDIQTDWLVYPNPATNLLYVNGDLNINTAQAEIVDIHGTRQHFRYSDDLSTIDISSLKPGIYLLQIRYGESQVVKRFVKY